VRGCRGLAGETFPSCDDGGRYQKTWHGDVKLRAEPFDDVELDLALLWQSLPPSAP
jgi:hypothetical protein